MAIDWGNLFRKYGPIAAQVGGAYIGSRVGQKATAAATQRSPEELAALSGATTAAGDMTGAGKDLFGQSKELLGQGKSLTGQGRSYLEGPASYYRTLLSGNRAAMSQAVAPATAQITGTYRGAERALQHSGVRGAARDVQAGELNRERASKIAGLTTGVQGEAAKSLAGLGSEMLGAATPMYGAGSALAGTAGGLYNGAGNVYGNLLGEGRVNRVYGRQEGQNAGAAMGGLVRDIGEAVFNPNKGRTPTPGRIPAVRRPGGQVPIPPVTAPPMVNAPPPLTPLSRPGGQVPFPGITAPSGANQSPFYRF